MNTKLSNAGHTAPTHLSDKAKDFYRETVESFDLEPHHVKLLVLACEASDESDACRAAIATEGLTILDRFGKPVPHPLLAPGQAARNQFERLLRALGLDLDAPNEPHRQPRRGGR